MVREELRKRIEFFEETYGLLLSYAARGLTGKEPGSEFRDRLEDAKKIAGEFPSLFNEAVAEMNTDSATPYDSFAELLAVDADAAQRTIDVVLAQDALSSQLIDNLNASIHFRALLTDLFLVEEIFHPRSLPQASKREV